MLKRPGGYCLSKSFYFMVTLKGRDFALAPLPCWRPRSNRVNQMRSESSKPARPSETFLFGS